MGKIDTLKWYSLQTEVAKDGSQIIVRKKLQEI